MKHTSNAGRLGFGCADLLRTVGRAETIALIETALDSGIHHFDVARMYGDGRAEALLGDVARGRRDEMIIATKVGIAPIGVAGRSVRKALHAAPWLGAAMPSTVRALAAPRAHLFAPRQVRASLETSLRELRVDGVDALLLHEISPDDVTDELVGALEQFRSAGKIKRWGLATSARSAAAIAAAYPELAEIVQCAALEADEAPPARTKRILHSVVRGYLAKLAHAVERDPGAARRLRDVGVDPSDRDAIARLALRRAAHAWPDAMILISSSRRSVVKQTAEMFRETPDEDHAGAAARALERVTTS